MASFRPALLLLLLSLAGCNAQLLNHDQMQMRKQLLSMYDDQLWDNLERTLKHQPIVQIDYSNILGQATGKSVAGVTGGHGTSLQRRSFDPATTPLAAAAQFTPTEIISDTVGYTGSAEQDLQLQVVGNPVTSTLAPYNAYIDFVAKKMFDRSPPYPNICNLGDAAYNPVKHGLANENFSRYNPQDKCYYYVKKDCEQQFFALFLVTAIDRTAAATPLSIVQAKVLMHVGDFKTAEGPDRVLVRFDADVPNSHGTAFLPLKNSSEGYVQLDVAPVAHKDGDPAAPQIAIGEKTRELFFVIPSMPPNASPLDKLKVPTTQPFATDIDTLKSKILEALDEKPSVDLRLQSPASPSFTFQSIDSGAIQNALERLNLNLQLQR